MQWWLTQKSQRFYLGKSVKGKENATKVSWRETLFFLIPRIKYREVNRVIILLLSPSLGFELQAEDLSCY